MTQDKRSEFVKKLDQRTRDNCIIYLSLIIQMQKTWSSSTFGSSPRTLGTIAHIRKELSEIEANPDDVEEWADLMIPATDGAWRRGIDPSDIAKAVIEKQEKNRARQWPTVGSDDQPIEHIRD